MKAHMRMLPWFLGSALMVAELWEGIFTVPPRTQAFSVRMLGPPSAEDPRRRGGPGV
jgi:hypothetical protein